MSTIDKSSDLDKSSPRPVRAENDPLVSCPIVCGEYMRATGFFFRAHSQMYLITARHNLFTTHVSITNPLTEGQLMQYSITGYHPGIDVYLRSDDGWVCEHIDTTESLDTRLNQQFNLDVVALKIEFDPNSFGYRIWTPKCLTDPEKDDNELMIVGFDGASFPSNELTYSVEEYSQSIGNPRLVPFENSIKEVSQFEIPLIGLGLDPQAAGSYTGLSGSPVIGDGLVGIHSCDDVLPKEALMRLSESHVRRLSYFRSQVLERLTAV